MNIANIILMRLCSHHFLSPKRKEYVMNIDGFGGGMPSIDPQRMRDMAFSKADADGNGAISKSEFQEMGKKMPGGLQGPGNIDRSEMFAKLDADGNGELSKAEASAGFDQMKAKMSSMMSQMQGQFSGSMMQAMLQMQEGVSAGGFDLSSMMDAQSAYSTSNTSDPVGQLLDTLIARDEDKAA
jgi:Ca2+-binding EF-hand superfamily protein